MGVRISWLMLARNSLLARLAASAASLALCNSASARRRFASVRSSDAAFHQISVVRKRMIVTTKSDSPNSES